MKFSICVTSYNRVNELSRLLKSVDSTKYKEDIEIIVSEDKSPKKEEIAKIVSDFENRSSYRVRFNTNENNLGYDRNLGKLKSLAMGDYIIYMSDDDVFMPGELDKYFDFLSDNDCSVCFQPFNERGRLVRKYAGNHYYLPSEDTAAKHIYDSILFSGLTFKRSCISDLDSEPFLNSNYFQVYMFMTVAYRYGLHYYNSVLVNCVSDGENAYGLSESSIKNVDLANRKSVFSILEFNKGLVWVVNRFDSENSTHCIDSFAKEYSLRSLPGMLRARRMGKDIYRDYISRIESLNMNLTYRYKIYKSFIALFGAGVTERLFALPKQILMKHRSNS